jgi:tetratricopeptide (TPR) repeat protein
MRRIRPLILVLLCLLTRATSGSAIDLPGELRRARELEKSGSYAQSMAAYRAVLQADPNNLDATIGLGRAHFLAHQYPEAAQRFERALQLSPGNSDVVDWLACSYLRSAEPQKAIDLIHDNGALVGQSAWSHLVLGHAYDALDRLKEAQAELKQALAIDPSCRGAHFALGFIAWTMRDLKNAEDEFTQELALKSHEYSAFYYLAETLELEGKLDDAGAILQRMRNESRLTYLYHFGAGKWDEYQKEFAKAAAEFRAAIQLDPDQSEAHYHLAIVLRKLGQPAQAAEEFNRANQLRIEMNSGMGQGMGKVRPHLPDLDAPPSAD